MVDIYVLNTDFQIMGLIDTYESFIWTDRFYSYGEFELYTAFDYDLIQLCKQNYYVWIKQSEHMMIIEGVEIESDADTGNKLKITGRSLECMIDRRIVWQQMTIAANTTFQNAVKRLMDDAFFYPQPYSGSYSASNRTRRRNASQLALANKRILKNLVFELSTDPYILGLKVDKVEYTGDNLYDIFTKMFEDAQNTVGYKITVKDNQYIVTYDVSMKSGKTYYELINGVYTVTTDTSFRNNKTYYEFVAHAFVFQLYTGVDRSYAQQEYVKTEDLSRNPEKTYYILQDNQYVEWVPASASTDFTKGVTYYEHRGKYPYVIFSPQFDNVINSNYIDNLNMMKNVTLVAGEGEGTARRTIIVGESEDLIRREIFTDARDMRLEDYGNNAAKYNDALKKRGLANLTEFSRITSYEGKVESTRQFVYGEDFFLGDIIQMANEYGIEGNARVVEWVLSDSADGIEMYPTFDAVKVLDTATTEGDDSDNNPQS